MDKRIKLSIVPVLLFLLILWLIEIIEFTTGFNIGFLGINPRQADGLAGIFFSPLLHSGFRHLIANSSALLVLGWFLFYFYKDIAWSIFSLTWIISGLITWLIGRSGIHIGASSLIYALAFFLFFSGIFRRNQKLWAVSFITIFIYGSMFWNMLPISELITPGTSWEGHLSGAIAGMCCSLIFIRKGPLPDKGIEDIVDETDADNEVPENQPYIMIKEYIPDQQQKSGIRNDSISEP